MKPKTFFGLYMSLYKKFNWKRQTYILLPVRLADVPSKKSLQIKEEEKVG